MADLNNVSAMENIKSGPVGTGLFMITRGLGRHHGKAQVKRLGNKMLGEDIRFFPLGTEVTLKDGRKVTLGSLVPPAGGRRTRSHYHRRRSTRRTRR